MSDKNTYYLVGVMSGTSLDGLDLALCRFEVTPNSNKYAILKADTIKYPDDLAAQLRSLHKSGAEEFCRTDREYGHYIGKAVNKFLEGQNIVPDAVASHGHTIFHNPADGYTVQIGHGAAIAAETGIPVINDFRSKDVALGGQGAPLVPVGDRDLFSEYDSCLNLGGFANISFERNGKRIAGDIAVCNFMLNMLAQKAGQPYDKDGEMARSGKVIPGLLASLNHLPYYQKPFPKSLGREWVENNLIPMIPEDNDIPDLLATFTQHSATKTAEALQHTDGETVLVTGGGAYNKFLMEKIRAHSQKKIIIPAKEIVDYKEALIFAWLGLLRMTGKINILAEVTGAKSDSSGGALLA
ncbi:MAG: anhydro-N-acetylmuramic acid kinase [Marinilabiliales bacterium]|nr:MAG: anhydro-N-acetylmuramic acid kinase [Marinilabiliales bacterium]